MKLSVTLNGESVSGEVPANQTLSGWLRSQGAASVKDGCESGSCGCCTVLVEGRPVYSCNLLAVQIDGARLETYEASIGNSLMDPLKQVFMDFGDVECDYCLPGLMMATRSLLESRQMPETKQVEEALKGVACRCTTQALPVDAVLEAISKIRGQW